MTPSSIAAQSTRPVPVSDAAQAERAPSDRMVVVGETRRGGAAAYVLRVVRNVMGGGNVVIRCNGLPFSTQSYSSVSAARRAMRSGAALRRAFAAEASR